MTPAGVHAQPPITGWTVYPDVVPVAITALDPGWRAEDGGLLHTLSGSFGFGFRQIQDQWRSYHADISVAGYVIKLRSRPGLAADSVPIVVTDVRLETGPGGRPIVYAVLGVDCAELAARTDRDVTEGRAVMADAVRTLLLMSGVSTEEAVDSVARAWQAAPPTLALEISNTPTMQNDLPTPTRLDPALVSQTDRQVAEAVRQAGVSPGDYTGDEAKALDREVLAPAALDVLTQRLAAHSLQDLVLYGMHQLQCVVVHTKRVLGDVKRASAQLSVTWDPVERYGQLEREQLTLRRCAEAAIEAALRTPPSGTMPVDVVAWSEILAAANAYLAATSRSEAIHHQVAPQALRITDSYEIEIVPSIATNAASDDRPVYDFDGKAFRKARATYEVTDAGDLASDEDSSQRDGFAPPNVDEAMLQAFGATATDLCTVLLGLVTWPLESNGPDLAIVTMHDAVRHVLHATVMGEEPDSGPRAEAALRMLTSTSEDMAAADWKPWHVRSRQRRLLVQPVPVLEDGSLVVAPHFCMTSLQVYLNHLGQGQLPWSQPPAPTGVETALRKVRDDRNKALERQVSGSLRREGWVVVDGVKETKPQRLGVPRLSTEIDAVVGRPEAATIWLLEVKDPVDVYAVPEIRRHLDRFFAPAKKPPPYIVQFRRKLADLAPHADAVARAMGLPPRDPDSPYIVKALFVTRRPVPAGFVTSDAEFVSLPDLTARLRS